jgi:hypothetical protein
MVTAYNDDDDYSGTGCETAPNPGISKQKSVRRASLTDTDDNSVDFVSVDYRATGTTTAQKDAWMPRNASNGEWDPMAEVVEPEPPDGTEGLMIFQAYGHANKSDPAITHSFVELYNNTNNAINLGTGNYSLQLAPAALSADGTAWAVIDLTGTIPAHGSYLIRGAVVTEGASASRLDLGTVTPDVDGSFILDNDAFKVALMSNRTPLAVANPFNTDEAGTKAEGYVDMVGAGELNVVSGYETAPIGGISKQKPVRRKYLADTDNNAEDFKIYDYRDREDGLNSEDFEKCRPRTSAAGSWTPEFP